MGKKKAVRIQEENYNGYRITRKIRQDKSDEINLPFSTGVAPAERHVIENKAMLERFPMMRVLKWLANSDEISKVLETEGLKLFPIIEDSKYSVLLEGNLSSEVLLIRVKLAEMNDEDRKEFEEEFEIVAKDGEKIPDVITIKNESDDNFVDVLQYFINKSPFIPVIVFLDDVRKEDVYWKSCIRKLVILRLSLQYEVIKMVIDDILDFDPEHQDALKLKEDQVDGVVNMEFPPVDDVYYFITWNKEKECYLLRRDQEMSPRMDNSADRNKKNKKKK